MFDLSESWFLSMLHAYHPSTGISERRFSPICLFLSLHTPRKDARWHFQCAVYAFMIVPVYGFVYLVDEFTSCLKPDRVSKVYLKLTVKRFLIPILPWTALPTHAYPYSKPFQKSCVLL